MLAPAIGLRRSSLVNMPLISMWGGQMVDVVSCGFCSERIPQLSSSQHLQAERVGSEGRAGRTSHRDQEEPLAGAHHCPPSSITSQVRAFAGLVAGQR